MPDRRRPGEVREAIRDYLGEIKREASVQEIVDALSERVGSEVAPSSVRSSLRLSDLFTQTSYGHYRLSGRR